MLNLVNDLERKTFKVPKVKQYANDRVPTVEEIKKLIEYPDRQINFIVLLSLSTGIRVNGIIIPGIGQGNVDVSYILFTANVKINGLPGQTEPVRV